MVLTKAELVASLQNEVRILLHLAGKLDGVIARIAAQSDTHASMLANATDADFRAEVDVFGGPSSRGAFIVDQVLCGCAAYRTQLFLYLEACGLGELRTMDLWAGTDEPATA